MASQITNISMWHQPQPQALNSIINQDSRYTIAVRQSEIAKLNNLQE